LNNTIVIVDTTEKGCTRELKMLVITC